MGTGANAAVTLNTGGGIPPDLSIRQGKGAGRADRDAFPAVCAQVDGFRVVTEQAVKRTALKENGGPVSRTVHIGKRNDLIDRRFPHDAAPGDPVHDRRPERPFRKLSPG